MARWQVKAATTANINLAAALTSLDTANVGPGDNILVKNQTTTSQNGLYRLDASGIPQRIADGTSAHIIPAPVFVAMGTGAGRYRTTDGITFTKL
jgi:hypothetical protein